ncbi:hypothetical protein JQ580_24930 [Bradyrhizobium japonicum]|uniref:hypothetical protein n=1 Tax=Bradyrhizobium japonicum TaxID=375 RepID=UPI001BA58C08|nr:hypothetical protein [Bradyrhizobium japonicum]MBR0993970.1 hypothetical protein [Bradyrhizobium japonicum]
MVEFFTDDYRYQRAAQPYLTAIARGVRDHPPTVAFLLEGTDYEQSFRDAVPLWQKQWAARGSSKCPFWSNYWFNPCPSCNCRIDNSVSMEIDALFFLENGDGKILAVHIEMKREGEGLSIGQAEAYRPRAACYRDQRRVRKGILHHDHFIAVLFCGVNTDIPLVSAFFDRVITHDAAHTAIPAYPST